MEGELAAPTTNSPTYVIFGVGLQKIAYSHRIAWDFSVAHPNPNVQLRRGSWYVTDRDRLFRDAWSDAMAFSEKVIARLLFIQFIPLSTLCVYKDLLYSFYVFTTHYNYVLMVVVRRFCS